MEDYKFIQSGIDQTKIKEYASLLSSVFEKSNKYTETFLHWQYAENPMGTVVGFDAYYQGLLIGHYVTLPVIYTIKGKLTKGLLSLNTATHKDHQGKGLFTTLARKTYELGKNLGYEFVIGVANQNSTYGFLKKLDFYLIAPLDVKIGIGQVQPDPATEYTVKPFWNGPALQWRMKCPGTQYYFNHNHLYSKTDKPFIFAQLSSARKELSKLIAVKNTVPLKIWIGLSNNLQIKGLFFDLPDRLKPSPLNLIFKDLSGHLDPVQKNNIYLELLDFDAY